MKIKTQVSLLTIIGVSLSIFISVIIGTNLINQQNVNENNKRLNTAFLSVEKTFSLTFEKFEQNISDSFRKDDFRFFRSLVESSKPASLMVFYDALYQNLVKIGIENNSDYSFFLVDSQLSEPKRVFSYINSEKNLSIDGKVFKSTNFGLILSPVENEFIPIPQANQIPSGTRITLLQEQPYLTFKIPHFFQDDQAKSDLKAPSGYFIFKRELPLNIAEQGQYLGVNINVYNTDGEMLAGNIPMPKINELENQNLQNVNKIIDNHGRGYDAIIKAIYFNDQIVGYVSLSISQELTTKKINDTILSLSISGLIVLIFIGAISFFISLRITHPISDLIKKTQLIADGNFNLSIDKTSQNEIGELASAFEKMKNNIKIKVDELKKSEETHRTLFESSMDAILILDHSNSFVDCNSAALKLFGLEKKSDIIGSNPSLISPEFQPDGKSSEEKVKELFSVAVEKGSNFYDWEHKRIDGNVMMTTVLATRFEIDDRLYIQSTIRDVTNELAVQKQLRESQKMDAIGQLAGGVAHDFNNMLAGIMGAAQLLQFPERSLDAKGSKYVKMIIDASTRAAELTAKLLAFGRKGNISSTTIDINSIIDDTLAIFKRTIDKKVKISVLKKAENSIIIGDNSALQNSLLNLGINASHAMKNGGVLSIETRNISLNENYCSSSSFDLEPGEFIEIEIRDNGTGISPENVEKIFEPFFTTKKQGEGTGLGLASVYGTIQDHRGAINVYSEIGIGTVFHIYIPCVHGIEEKEQKNEVLLPGVGQILLVDDEELIRVTSEHSLNKMGYEVILAENGLKAVDIFKDKFTEIDLVIMDMIMPEMNGREAFYKMKEIDPNCKIIISSGFTKDENLKKLKEDGLLGFIQKPFRDYELSKLLAEIIEEYKLNQEVSS